MARAKKTIKQSDKLRAFRDALNYEAKLYCNVDDAYDMEKANDFLNQLTKSWKMDADSVIANTIKRVQDILDKQSRMYVLRFLDMMNIPYSKEEIKDRWEHLSDAEKDKVIKGVIKCLQEGDKNGE